MFLDSGKSPYPVERTLWPPAWLLAGVESLWQRAATNETPHLAIRYRPNPRIDLSPEPDTDEATQRKSRFDRTAE